MGEAKRRRDAIAWGQPGPRDLHVCPRCRSRDTRVEPAPAMALSAVPTLWGACRPCGAVWEAYPEGWEHDVCEAGAAPCDNCAFRPGSPEQSDTEAWKSLMAKLKHGGQEFRCHKGAPMKIDDVAGTVEFDADWINRHGRTCVGFHRAIMTKPGWLEARGRGAHVLTTHDQGRLLAQAVQPSEAHP